MFSLKEIAFLTAAATSCFLAGLFKAASALGNSDIYDGVILGYIIATFLLYVSTFLLFTCIQARCGDFKKNPDVDSFLTIKKLKNFSEVAYITVIIFFVGNIYDVIDLQIEIQLNHIAILTAYQFWEIILGIVVLIYGLHCYGLYDKENKTYSIVAFEEMSKKPQSVFKVIKQYTTAEEYEATGSPLPKPPKPEQKISDDAQDRFLEEYSVSEEEINRQLRGTAAVERRDPERIPLDILPAAQKVTPGKTKECPLCGSMNTAGSKECCFCGNELK